MCPVAVVVTDLLPDARKQWALARSFGRNSAQAERFGSSPVRFTIRANICFYIHTILLQNSALAAEAALASDRFAFILAKALL
jgi:hypothetical protein